jgi:hypothetical protein
MPVERNLLIERVFEQYEALNFAQQLGQSPDFGLKPELNRYSRQRARAIVFSILRL